MTGNGAKRAEPERAGRPVILVVEDEILVRMSIVEDLLDAGFSIIEASDADEALTLLGAGVDVDLVFSDIQMPGNMDGIGLWQAIRERYPWLPVILTSGEARPLAEHADSGLVFIPKPYPAELVVGLVREGTKDWETRNGPPDGGA